MRRSILVGLDKQELSAGDRQDLLSLAGCHIQRMPCILSRGRRMSVWSDVKEILFPSCSNPHCNIVLDALKSVLKFQSSDTDIRACTAREHLTFLRQFRIVPTGTLMVNVDEVCKHMETLWKIIPSRHSTSKNPNSKQCQYRRVLSDKLPLPLSSTDIRPNNDIPLVFYKFSDITENNANKDNKCSPSNGKEEQVSQQDIGSKQITFCESNIVNNKSSISKSDSVQMKDYRKSHLSSLGNDTSAIVFEELKEIGNLKLKKLPHSENSDKVPDRASYSNFSKETLVQELFKKCGQFPDNAEKDILIPGFRCECANDEDSMNIFIPASCIGRCVPGMKDKLIEICGKHLVNSESRTCRQVVTRCCTSEEGRTITRWFHKTHGWGGNWQHITSRDLLIYLKDFMSYIDKTMHEEPVITPTVHTLKTSHVNTSSKYSFVLNSKLIEKVSNSTANLYPRFVTQNKKSTDTSTISPPNIQQKKRVRMRSPEELMPPKSITQLEKNNSALSNPFSECSPVIQSSNHPLYSVRKDTNFNGFQRPAETPAQPMTCLSSQNNTNCHQKLHLTQQLNHNKIMSNVNIPCKGDTFPLHNFSDFDYFHSKVNKTKINREPKACSSKSLNAQKNLVGKTDKPIKKVEVLSKYDIVGSILKTAEKNDELFNSCATVPSRDPRFETHHSHHNSSLASPFNAKSLSSETLLSKDFWTKDGFVHKDLKTMREKEIMARVSLSPFTQTVNDLKETKSLNVDSGTANNKPSSYKSKEVPQNLQSSNVKRKTSKTTTSMDTIPASSNTNKNHNMDLNSKEKKISVTELLHITGESVQLTESLSNTNTKQKSNTSKSEVELYKKSKKCNLPKKSMSDSLVEWKVKWSDEMKLTLSKKHNTSNKCDINNETKAITGVKLEKSDSTVNVQNTPLKEIINENDEEVATILSALQRTTNQSKKTKCKGDILLEHGINDKTNQRSSEVDYIPDQNSQRFKENKLHNLHQKTKCKTKRKTKDQNRHSKVKLSSLNTTESPKANTKQLMNDSTKCRNKSKPSVDTKAVTGALHEKCMTIDSLIDTELEKNKGEDSILSEQNLQRTDDTMDTPVDESHQNCLLNIWTVINDEDESDKKLNIASTTAFNTTSLELKSKNSYISRNSSVDPNCLNDVTDKSGNPEYRHPKKKWINNFLRQMQLFEEEYAAETVFEVPFDDEDIEEYSNMLPEDVNGQIILNETSQCSDHSNNASENSLFEPSGDGINEYSNISHDNKECSTVNENVNTQESLMISQNKTAKGNGYHKKSKNKKKKCSTTKEKIKKNINKETFSPHKTDEVNSKKDVYDENEINVDHEEEVTAFQQTSDGNYHEPNNDINDDNKSRLRNIVYKKKHFVRRSIRSSKSPISYAEDYSNSDDVLDEEEEEINKKSHRDVRVQKKKRRRKKKVKSKFTENVDSEESKKYETKRESMKGFIKEQEIIFNIIKGQTKLNKTRTSSTSSTEHEIVKCFSQLATESDGDISLPTLEKEESKTGLYDTQQVSSENLSMPELEPMTSEAADTSKYSMSLSRNCTLNAGSDDIIAKVQNTKTKKTKKSDRCVLKNHLLPEIKNTFLVNTCGGGMTEPPGIHLSKMPIPEGCEVCVNLIDLSYDSSYNEEGKTSGGMIYHPLFVLPYVLVNGYKCVTVVDAVKIFVNCKPKCQIPKAVLQKHKALYRTFCTWEQVYTLDLLFVKRGRTIKTGDMMIRWQSLLDNYWNVYDSIKVNHLQKSTKSKVQCRYTFDTEDIQKERQ